MPAIIKEDQDSKVLNVLRAADGGWVSGKVLLEASGGTVLSGRLGSLRFQGWQVESRPSAEGGEFYDYRLIGKGEPRGRKQVPVDLPKHPRGRAWSDADVAKYKSALEGHLAYLVSLDFPQAEPDWFDLLLGAGAP